MLFPVTVSGPPSKIRLFGPTWVHNTNSISISSAFFVRLTFASNRHRLWNISDNRPHLMLCLAMWPDNISSQLTAMYASYFTASNNILTNNTHAHTNTHKYMCSQHTQVYVQSQSQTMTVLNKLTAWNDTINSTQWHRQNHNCSCTQLIHVAAGSGNMLETFIQIVKRFLS